MIISLTLSTFILGLDCTNGTKDHPRPSYGMALVSDDAFKNFK